MIIEGDALLGSHKWLGGAMLSDRHIVGVPSHHSCVISVDCETDAISLIETGAPKGKYKWLRGVALHSTVYGLPCSADKVLKVTSDHEISFLDLPTKSCDWQWHGGVAMDDDTIFAPPCNAGGVLEIQGDECFVRDIPDAKNRSQYYGAVRLDDSVFGIPFAASRVLDLTTREFVGPDLGAGFENNWHGGLRREDTVYGFPANADSVLAITHDSVDLLPVPGERGRYQWGGGVASSTTGTVYGIPSDASDILRIHRDNSVSRFGNLGSTKNKWQNGVEGPDGKIYCVPCDAEYVLVIDPSTDTLDKLFLPPTISSIKDKWQGAFLVADAIWAIPEQAPAVLKLEFYDRRKPPRIRLIGGR